MRGSTFAREPDGIYYLIIVDAYSSDAIPIHLATEEAMAIYKQKLAPQGAVLMVRLQPPSGTRQRRGRHCRRQ